MIAAIAPAASHDEAASGGWRIQQWVQRVGRMGRTPLVALCVL